MSNTRLPVQNQASYLAGSGCVAGATTIILQSFTQIDGTVLTMSNFGTKGFMTLEPNNSTQEEQISFTGITQNANGTATLTGVSTVLTVSPYTETSGVATTHPGGATAIVTNTAQWYNQFTAKGNDETVTGAWLFPTPLADFNPATKKYVDDLVNGGTVTNAAVIVSATAGETVSVGQLLYFSETDNEWLKCDADTAATVQSVMLGISQGAGTNGNPITGGVLIFGTDSNQSGMTQGDLMYASNTAGGISSTAGTNPRVIGIAVTPSSLYFNPYFQSELTRYAVDAVGTDSYAVTLPGAFNAYYAGMVVNFKAGTGNTGACTLNVNGKGAQAIKKGGTTALSDGDIISGQICTVIYDGTNFQLTSNIGNQSSAPQTFTASGTWTKPNVGAQYALVELFGGGGGGGGGRSGISGDDTGGGGGGGGGGYSRWVFALADLGATETVTIGAGGTAGAVGNNSDGGSGGTGGTTSFGLWLSAVGGSGGSGGTGAAGGTGGAGGAGLSGTGATGGNGGFNVNGVVGGSNGIYPTGGGGGGGTTGTERTGGAGGATTPYVTAGGTAGGNHAIGGAGNAPAASTEMLGGTGGGGGGSSTGATTTNGGGVGVRGGGGGGGGSNDNGATNSGAGGVGGDGFVRVTVY